MRRPLVVLITMWLSCGLTHAQSTTAMPGIGATSPLGVLGSTASGTGIPLGATEIDPGGLSPAPSNTMNSASVCTTLATTGGSSSAMGSGMSEGSGSSFDGGGLSGTASGVTSTGGCPNATTPSNFGTASPQSTSGAGTSSIGRPQLRGGTIPLGAFELGNAGVSPMIGVPAPNSLTTPCAGSTTGLSGLGGSGVSPDLTTGTTDSSLAGGMPGLGSQLGC